MITSAARNLVTSRCSSCGALATRFKGWRVDALLDPQADEPGEFMPLIWCPSCQPDQPPAPLCWASGEYPCTARIELRQERNQVIRQRVQANGTREDLEAVVLKLLQDGPATSGDLARRLARHGSLIGRALHRLEARALVVRIGVRGKTRIWEAVA